jgi:hypothetical protein
MSEFVFDRDRMLKAWAVRLDAWMLEGAPLPPIVDFLSQEFAAQFVEYQLAQEGILAA